MRIITRAKYVHITQFINLDIITRIPTNIHCDRNHNFAVCESFRACILDYLYLISFSYLDIIILLYI